MYWSPERIFLFKQFMKSNETGSISIDAIESLIKLLFKPNGSKDIIFLYQAQLRYYIEKYYLHIPNNMRIMT